ncbi:MAG: hypothetical protein AAF517_21805 [Planctomycetota bacterium]
MVETRSQAQGGSGKRLATLLIIAVVVAGAAWGAKELYPDLLGEESTGSQRHSLTYAAARLPMQVVVNAEGNVESASNVEVKCRVAGGSTILWIVEDGKSVAEGEEIVRLDDSSIRDSLNSQRIVYERALATKIQAEQDVEAAAIAVKEYEEGTFIESLKQFEADIQVAMENLRSAENQLKYSQKMVRKGFVSSLQRDADEFAVERAKLDLDVAQTKKKGLVQFTKKKMVKQLTAAKEIASAKLRSENAGLDLEKDRLDRLEAQLNYCIIKAPKKGMVVYANARRSRYSSREAEIEEGAAVRETLQADSEDHILLSQIGLMSLTADDVSIILSQIDIFLYHKLLA